MSIASANHPLSYLRYGDDIFAVFETNESCLKFLHILNFHHKNTKFTVEYGSELMCCLTKKLRLWKMGATHGRGAKLLIVVFC